METVVQPDEEVDAAEGWESNARSEAAALRVDEEADVERTMGPSSTWSAIIERVKQRENVDERGGRGESVVGEAREGLVAPWVGFAERVSEGAEEAVERRGDEGSERASNGAKQILLCYAVFDLDPTREGGDASQGGREGEGGEEGEREGPEFFLTLSDPPSRSVLGCRCARALIWTARVHALPAPCLSARRA